MRLDCDNDVHTALLTSHYYRRTSCSESHWSCKEINLLCIIACHRVYDLLVNPLCLGRRFLCLAANRDQAGITQEQSFKRSLAQGRKLNDDWVT